MPNKNEMQMWKCELKVPCQTHACYGRAAWFLGKPEMKHDARILCVKCANELAANIPNELNELNSPEVTIDEAGITIGNIIIKVNGEIILNGEIIKEANLIPSQLQEEEKETPQNDPEPVNELPDDSSLEVVNMDNDTVHAVNDATDDVEEISEKLTVKRLREIAKGKGITGYSRMKEDELIAAIEGAG